MGEERPKPCRACQGTQGEWVAADGEQDGRDEWVSCQVRNGAGAR